MTDILLLNIKLKDEAYVKYRKAKNPIEQHQLKTKLRTMESDIKRWIIEAKSNYYSEQFNKHKNDIKKTWDVIKTAINKRRVKSNFPEHFTVNGVNIFDKTQIANEFNKFFTSIGPELADSLDTTGKPSFDTFLGEKPPSRFTFNEVSSDEISKIIKNLQAKKSSSPDGISTFLLKEIADIITSALTISINQSLKSGIFPSLLKLAGHCMSCLYDSKLAWSALDRYFVMCQITCVAR